MATTDMQRPSDGTLATRIWHVLTAVPRSWNRFWRRVALYMPKRLYARSLLIVITPMILLQSVVAFVFMERHWQTVTVRLSQAVTRDIVAHHRPDRHVSGTRTTRRSSASRRSACR